MTTIIPGTGAFYERSKQDIGALRTRAEMLQQQLATGQKLARASDDPLAAAGLRALARQDADARVTAANAGRATADLNRTDGALSSIADAIDQAKQLATQAANATLSPAQRAGIGTALLALHDQVLAIANGKDASGNALFGGQGTGDAYTLDAAGNAVYAGTAGAGSLDLGDGQSVTRGITGPQVFGAAPGDLFAQLETLGGALQSGAATGATQASAALTTLGTALDTVTTQQTIVGMRLAFVDDVTARAATLADARTAAKTELGGVDLPATIAELQHAMLVLDASQASFARLSGLSLFDHLR